MAAPEEVEFFEAKRAIRYIGGHRRESADQIIRRDSTKLLEPLRRTNLRKTIFHWLSSR